MQTTKKTHFIFILLLVCIYINACNSHKPLDELRIKDWNGDILRKGDNQELSQAKMKLSNDTMFLFSNAIFGSENDTLILTDFTSQDSTITLKSINSDGQSWKLKYEFTKVESKDFVALHGDGYYIYLIETSNDVTSPEELSFYLNRQVPDNPDYYLFGAYEGDMEFENPLLNLFSTGYGGIHIKFIFTENFKVKIYGRALLFSGNDEEQTYSVRNDELYIGSSNQGLKIIDHGNKLVVQTEDSNIILTKNY